MALIQDVPLLLEELKNQGERLEHNKKLYDINEGSLLPYVLEDLRAQLSQKSFEVAKHRVAPINVLKRIIDKLSKIYAKPPMRSIEGGTAGDEDLLKFYSEQMNFNVALAQANMFFNLHKACWVEPFLDRGFPRLRALPADRFIVYSNDTVNPLRPTHLMKLMGTIKRGDKQVKIFYCYSAEEFVVVDEEGRTVPEVMSRPDIVALGGGNPYGALPGVYVARSRHELTPKIDTDTLAMTKLIPILLSDLNYAVMFQCFSIIYGIDVDQEGLKFAPNVLWDLKSDKNSDSKPQIGTIKPEVDTDKVISLIKTTLSFWMQTRNIKPGAMGELSVENAASGISKAIDEMDTSEDRQEQASYFQETEARLGELIKDRLHPQWIRIREFQGPRMLFSPACKIKTTFPEQRPLVDSSKAIADQKTKMDIRIQSRKGALKELYPDWTDKQIEEKLAEVDEEAAQSAEIAQEQMAEQGMMEGEQPMPGKEMPAQKAKQPVEAKA